MRGLHYLLGATIVLALAGAAYPHGTQYPWDWYTTGVYDENATRTNEVDIQEPGNTKTLAQFKSDVAAAFEGNYGGVCGWDYSRNLNQMIQGDTTSNYYGLSDGTSGRADNRMRPLWKVFTATNSSYKDGYIANGYNNEPIEIFYGKDWSKVGPAIPGKTAEDFAAPDHANGKRIQIDVWDNMDIWSQDNTIASSLSGNAWLRQSNSTTVPQPPLVAGSGGILSVGNADRSDQVPGQDKKAGLLFHRELDPTHPEVTATWTSQVKEIGFTALSMGGTDRTFTAWAVYSDGVSSDTRTVSTSAAYGVGDTFFYFVAPAGKFINEIWWESNQSRPAIDDLGFIVDNSPPAPVWHPGDANKDGVVDLQDFGLLKENFGIGIGEGALWEQGDFNADGGIDLQDFGILKDHFGHTTGDVPVTAVPEPATMSLLALAGLGLLRRRAR